MSLTRQCPKCNKTIRYKSLECKKQCEKKQSPCRACFYKTLRKYDKYIRNCPKCNKEISYCYGPSFYTARKKNTLCIECGKIVNAENQRNRQGNDSWSKLKEKPHFEDVIRLAYPTESAISIAKALGIKKSAVTKFVQLNYLYKEKVQIGEIFGRLTIIEYIGLNKKGHKLWKCKCNCSNIVNVSTTDLLFKRVRSCGCLRYKNNYRNIYSVWFKRVKKGAKDRNIEFKVTIEYLSDLLEKQNWKCFYTGIQIIMSFRTYNETTASLDRVNSKFGYIEGNVVFCHKDVNRAKWAFEVNYFEEMCTKIYLNNENKKTNQIIDRIKYIPMTY